MSDAEQFFGQIAFAFADIDDAVLEKLKDRFVASIGRLIETQDQSDNDATLAVVALQSCALAVTNHRINELEKEVEILKAMLDVRITKGGLLQ